MKILIPTIGSRGDVQPFIALAQGLAQAQHDVTLASHPIMKDLVESHGVGFASIGPDIDLALEAAILRQHSRNAAAGLMRTMRFGLEMVEQSHDDIMTLCRDAELVVVPASSAAGKNEADKVGLPYLSVTLMPWAIPWDDPERPLVKRLVYGAIDRLVALITTVPLNRMRKRQSLPPVGKEGFTSKRLNLVPVSPAIYPANPLWEDRHHLVGYWFAESPSEWQPPQDLLAFLEHGPPPVLISLGAMTLGDDDSQTANLFVEAVQQAGQRAIIQGWQTAIAQINLPPSILAAGALPHSWLLPRCAGTVHHGGFGTTSSALRAGIPALVIPHVADQFYWGQRVHELGAGPQPIPRSKLDAPGLVNGLQEMVNNQNLVEAAATLGKQITAEDGISNAIRLIENTFL